MKTKLVVAALSFALMCVFTGNRPRPSFSFSSSGDNQVEDEGRRRARGGKKQK